MLMKGCLKTSGISINWIRTWILCLIFGKPFFSLHEFANLKYKKTGSGKHECLNIVCVVCGFWLFTLKLIETFNLQFRKQTKTFLLWLSLTNEPTGTDSPRNLSTKTKSDKLKVWIFFKNNNLPDEPNLAYNSACRT